MKFMFLSVEELNQIVTSIVSNNGQKVTCKVAFSEEEDMDVVEVYVNNEEQPVNTLVFEKLLSELAEHLNQPFHSYDVMEVGDFGVGFAFFF